MATSDRSPRELERAVATRLGSQATLSRPDPPQVKFVIDESVLGRTLGDESVLRAQLDHLLVLGKRDNVEVRVIPLGGPAHPGMNGSFSFFELADGTAYAFTESQGFAVCLMEPVDLKRVVRTCKSLDDIALDERESKNLINEALEAER